MEKGDIGKIILVCSAAWKFLKKKTNEITIFLEYNLFYSKMVSDKQATTGSHHSLGSLCHHELIMYVRV